MERFAHTSPSPCAVHCNIDMRTPNLSMYWILLAVGLVALGGLWLTASYRELDARSRAIDDALALVRRTAEVAEDSGRRAHLRLDNQQRQLDAMGKELGWVDDRSRTKVLTAKLPPSETP